MISIIDFVCFFLFQIEMIEKWRMKFCRNDGNKYWLDEWKDLAIEEKSERIQV